MWKILIAITVVARLVPHPFGFTPMGTLGLFSGAHLKPSIAWTVPIGALLLGDLVTGLYDWRVMIFVYIGFLVAPLLSRLLLKEKVSIGRVASGITGSAIAFYLISNIGNWLVFYPHTMSSLIQCYIMGLPFLGIMLVGDSIYAALLFGGYAALEKRLPQSWSTT